MLCDVGVHCDDVVILDVAYEEDVYDPIDHPIDNIDDDLIDDFVDVINAVDEADKDIIYFDVDIKS